MQVTCHMQISDPKTYSQSNQVFQGQPWHEHVSDLLKTKGKV